MGNLQQAIAESQLQTPASKSGGIRIADFRTLRQLLDEVFAGTPKSVSPTAWAGTWLQSRKFYKVAVPANIACPTPKNRATNFLGTVTAAAEAEGVIVVDVNKARVGQSASGFLPQVVVVRGHNRYLAERAAGKAYITAWVGELAAMRLNLIHADHQFGANELRQKLQDALEEKYPGKKLKAPMTGIDWKTRPSIVELYPLENYLVYSKDDCMYKHTYTADQSKRTVALTGTPQEVKQKYVDINASSVVKIGTVGLDAAAISTPFPKLSKVKAGLTPVKERESITEMDSRKKKKKVNAGTGYVGYPGATKKRNVTRPNQPTFEEKTKGGTKSENANVMAARAAVGKIVTRYNAAISAGYKPMVEAVAPPGMEHVVKAIKPHVKDKASAFKIAWWLKQRKQGK